MIYILILLAIILFYIFETTFFKTFKETELDLARFRLFNIRNNLFQYSIDNEIQDSDAIFHATEMINNHIRFLHKANALDFLVFSIKVTREKRFHEELNKLNQLMQKRLKGVGTEHKQKIDKALNQSRVELFKYLVYSSPILHLVAKIILMNHQNTGIVDKNREIIKFTFEVEAGNFKTAFA